MAPSSDEFLRLEGLIFRPVSTHPDCPTAWQSEANEMLLLASRADDADDIESLEELEEQAREMAAMVEPRWQGEGLRPWPGLFACPPDTRHHWLTGQTRGQRSIFTDWPARRKSKLACRRRR